MKLMLAALIAVLCATAVSTMGAQVARQVVPEGEFHIVPSSGPIGTVVTIEGEFDQDITAINLRCWFSDTREEAFGDAQMPTGHSPSFRLEYEIPTELLVREPRTDTLTRSPLGGDCTFLAQAGQIFTRRSVLFTVTEAAAMPSTGHPPRSRTEAGASTALALVAGGATLGLLGWRSRRQRINAG